MAEAVKEAEKALAIGEVPVGCVIVYDAVVIGRGANRTNATKNVCQSIGGSGRT